VDISAFKNRFLSNASPVQDDQIQDSKQGQIRSRSLPNDMEQSLATNLGDIDPSKESSMPRLKSIQDGTDQESSASHQTHQASVDALLHAWGNALWARPGETDPFRHDWTPVRCEYE
jgi:hypothetical protein